MSPAASLAGAVFLLTLGAFVGLYLTSAPIATVNWDAESGQRWVVPLGGGVGKIFHFGRLLVNAQLSAYYNVVRPDVGANWQIRAQMQLMFPKEFLYVGEQTRAFARPTIRVR